MSAATIYKIHFATGTKEEVARQLSEYIDIDTLEVAYLVFK